jgi:PIN domain nuclease of toxin-antitoxin system
MNDRNGLLLDTHAWFWIVCGDARVPAPLVEVVEAAAVARKVYVSQISAWEIALKEAAGKIRLSSPVHRWLEESARGLQLLDLPLEVVIDATRLPGTFHKDPADRLIVATARHHRLTLVTGDEAILAYAREGHVDVLPL